eukprot:scaffold49080_cov87-Phaeocystis_antarctica.AAC.1
MYWEGNRGAMLARRWRVSAERSGSGNNTNKRLPARPTCHLGRAGWPYRTSTCFRHRPQLRWR